MDSSNHQEGSQSQGIHQNIVVMRHGDRIDAFEPLWISTAARPWDPQLIEDGLIRAFCNGRRFRTNLGFPIHRVFVSPFRRCIQTASEVVSAFCAVDDDPKALTSKDVASIDPSKLKVAIEFGLCEMLNKIAIRNDAAPKDGDFGFNISKLEALLPVGTVDPNVQRVYEKMPQWEETVEETRCRYVEVIKALAEKYPSENLLLVTHGEAVGVTVSAFSEDKNITVLEVEYCGHARLRRHVFSEEESITSEDFEMLTKSGQTGVSFISPTKTDAAATANHA